MDVCAQRDIAQTSITLLTLQQKWAVREDLLSRVGLAYGRTAGGGVRCTILSVMDSLRRHFCASSKCRRRRDESRKMRDVRVYSVRKAPFKHPSSTTWSYAPRCDLRIVMKVIRLGAQSRERLHIVIPVFLLSVFRSRSSTSKATKVPKKLQQQLG